MYILVDRRWMFLIDLLAKFHLLGSIILFLEVPNRSHPYFFLYLHQNATQVTQNQGLYGAGEPGKSREFETGFSRAGNSLDIGCFGDWSGNRQEF